MSAKVFDTKNEALSTAYLEAGTVILRNCNDGRERSLALTKLQEAFMWANSALAVEAGLDLRAMLVEYEANTRDAGS